MRRLPLRTQATVVATLVTFLTLAIGSVVLVSVLEDRLTAGADQVARTRVNDLLDVARTGDLPAALRNVDDESVAQVVAADGRVLAATPNIEGRGPLGDVDPGDELVVRNIRGPDDDETENYRVWIGSGPGAEGPVTVYAGSSLESVTEASAVLRRALWVGVPLVSVLLGWAIWMIVGRALARLDRIRAEMDTVTRTDTRIADDGVGDEVGRLAATMNRMLERLEDSALRQRQFVADVSHDLQSPLAAQRATLEVALAGRPDPEVERLGRALLSATDEMERLVADLLVLAAAEDGDPVVPVPIDLDELVLEEAVRARASSHVDIDTSRVSAAPARTHPADARRAVRNLLDNAVAHAATRVELVVGVEDGWARLDVVDDGPGVEDGGRVFDRFYRGDVSRARHAGGSGLGLPIARTLATRNGGTVSLVADGSGASFVLRLPTP